MVGAVIAVFVSVAIAVGVDDASTVIADTDGSVTLENVELNNDGHLVAWTASPPADVVDLEYLLFAGDGTQTFGFAGHLTPGESPAQISPICQSCSFYIQVTGARPRPSDQVLEFWSATSSWVMASPLASPTVGVAEVTDDVVTLNIAPPPLPPGATIWGYRVEGSTGGQTVFVQNFGPDNGQPPSGRLDVYNCGSPCTYIVRALIGNPGAPNPTWESPFSPEVHSERVTVGSVTEVVGDVTIIHDDGTTTPAVVGSAVSQGDVIETSLTGAVSIRFADDTTFAISDSARLVIDHYTYMAAEQSGSSFFSLLQGLFVYTSGLIGQNDPDARRLDTLAGGGGIRGTELIVRVSPADDFVRVDLGHGEIAMNQTSGTTIMLGPESAEFNSAGLIRRIPLTTAEYDSLKAQVLAVFQTPPVDQSISFDPLADIVYGGTPDALAATATSGLPVSFSSTSPTVCGVTNSVVEVRSAGICTIQADQPGDTNHTAAVPATQSFQISKAPITVRADDLARPYGSINPALTADLDGFVNGDSPAASDVSGSPSCTTTATAHSVPGDYAISCTLGTLDSNNYTFDTFHDGTLSVDRAVLTVTPTDKTRRYGAADPTLKVTFGGFALGQNLTRAGIAGAPDCTTAASATSPVGDYPITCTTGTLTASNYTFTFQTGLLTVTPKTLRVKAANKTQIYGAEAPVLTVNYSGFANGETLETSGVTGDPECTTTATPASPVGTYPITCDPGTLEATNYTLSLIDGIVTVKPATVKVTPVPLTQPYGSPVPTAFEVTHSGFVNQETLETSGISGSPQCATTAITSSAVGKYPVTCAQGTLAATNYRFAFPTGRLTVGKATLTITADDQARAHGVPNPPLTATVTGFQLGETNTAPHVTGAPKCTTAAKATSVPGDYAITCSKGTLASANYAFTYVAGVLKVG